MRDEFPSKLVVIFLEKKETFGRKNYTSLCGISARNLITFVNFTALTTSPFIANN